VPSKSTGQGTHEIAASWAIKQVENVEIESSKNK
jgi:hypothetical protein